MISHLPGHQPFALIGPLPTRRAPGGAHLAGATLLHSSSSTALGRGGLPGGGGDCAPGPAASPGVLAGVSLSMSSSRSEAGTDRAPAGLLSPTVFSPTGFCGSKDFHKACILRRGSITPKMQSVVCGGLKKKKSFCVNRRCAYGRCKEILDVCVVKIAVRGADGTRRRLVCTRPP